jgi:transposase
MCGVTTHIVASVEVSGAAAHYSPYFKPLAEQAARVGFNMKEISADKVTSAPTIADRRRPRSHALHSIKSNVTGKRGSELWKKLFHYYSFNPEDFLIHYHKRSNVETTFSMIKAKFGERLRCKTETAQVNKALTKVLCHNLRRNSVDVRVGS